MYTQALKVTIIDIPFRPGQLCTHTEALKVIMLDRHIRLVVQKVCLHEQTAAWLLLQTSGWSYLHPSHQASLAHLRHTTSFTSSWPHQVPYLQQTVAGKPSQAGQTNYQAFVEQDMPQHICLQALLQCTSSSVKLISVSYTVTLQHYAWPGCILLCADAESYCCVSVRMRIQSGHA